MVSFHLKKQTNKIYAVFPTYIVRDHVVQEPEFHVHKQNASTLSEN